MLNQFTYPEPTGTDALDLIEDGTADLTAFGALFPTNPGPAPPSRRRRAVQTPDKATFHGGDHRGYTDYPTLEG